MTYEEIIVETLTETEAEYAEAVAAGDTASAKELKAEIASLKAVVAVNAGEIAADEAPGSGANTGIHA